MFKGSAVTLLFYVIVIGLAFYIITKTMQEVMSTDINPLSNKEVSKKEIRIFA